MLNFTAVPAARPALRTAQRATPAVVAARARCTRSADADAETDASCGGWHDSSYDLSRGLAVTEHGDLDDGATLALAVGLWLN